MTLEDLYRLLRSGHVQAQGVVDTMTQPIVVLDHGLSVITANNAFIKTFNVERDDILGQSFFDLGSGQWDIPDLRRLVKEVIPKAAAVVGFEVKHDFPVLGERTFLVDARRLVHPDDNSTNLLILFDDITERRHEDAEKDFVLSEMRHRIRNLSSVVRASIMQTATGGRTVDEYRDVILGRVEVVLRAQEIASANAGLDIEDLIRRSVGEIAVARLFCNGPPIMLDGQTVLGLSMMIHELTTNALKYGALLASHGRVHVSWSLFKGREDRRHVRLDWQELNGPPVRPPTRVGYGTELIEGMAAHLGGEAELEYPPDGLVAVIQFPCEAQ
jgi:two-component sensor histidine kinase